VLVFKLKYKDACMIIIYVMTKKQKRPSR